MKDIITLTSAAVLHVRAIMQKHKGAVGFCLSVKHTGCSGYMYHPRIVDKAPLDYICLTMPDSLNVFVDPGCVQLIKGLKIDFVEKSLGVKQLSYTNPNVDTTCGCGESFSLKEDATDVTS